MLERPRRFMRPACWVVGHAMTATLHRPFCLRCAWHPPLAGQGVDYYDMTVRRPRQQGRAPLGICSEMISPGFVPPWAAGRGDTDAQ